MEQIEISTDTNLRLINLHKKAFEIRQILLMTMKDIEIKYQPLEPTAFFSDKTEDE
jgi:hypothetical protein